MKADFPDFQMRSGGERRLIFQDAGGGAEGAIKFASNTMKFFAGGIGSSDEVLSLAASTSTFSNNLQLDGTLTLGSTNIATDLADKATAINLRALAADGSHTGTTKFERIEVDSDGGYFLRFDRNTSTQLDIITGNIPSGGNLNIKNSNGTDAKVVVYSDLFWVRNLGGNNGNGKVKFDGSLTFDSVELTGVQTSSESFSDDDVSLMTSAAISDRITAQAVTASDLHVDDLLTAVGIASEATGLGTFTGSTISDNGTIKAGMQELETSLETKFATSGGTLTGSLTVSASFPDINIKSNGERRLIFADAGGGANAALKYSSSELQFTYGGVASGDVELKIADAKVTVVNELALPTTVSAAAASDITLVDNTADALEIVEGSNQYIAITTTDSSEKVEVFKNLHLAGERLYFDSGSQLIRLKDNQTSALKIENHDGSSLDFLDFKTANSGELLSFGAPNQFNNTITVGVDDTGYDVKFFGATASAYLLWDDSADDLILAGAAGLVVPDGQLTLGSTAVTSTAAELNILDGVTSTAAELNILDGVTSTTAELNFLDGSTAGTAVASKALVLDSNKDATGLRNLTLTGNLTVQGTTTTVNTVTMEAANAIVFEGASADDHETTLTIIDPDADRTIKLPNQSGCLPVLAADSATAITSTPEELNILDGVTSTAAELNILDGVTSTTAELNLLDGVTATTTELNYVDGVTSAIQTQLDAKQAADADLTNLAGCQSGASAAIAALTQTEVEILDGATVTTDELNILDGVTSTTAELNILDGVTSTAAELNILDGVTSTAAELNILDGGTASAADINLIDGITNGTVIASKAIITDANKDITGGRNITITGELDAATLDISGDADIDGTANLDAVDIDGAVDIAGSINISAAQTLSVVDNQAQALAIMEGSNNYINIRTSDSSERVEFNKAVKFAAALDINADLDIDADIDLAGDLTFSAVKDIKIVDNDSAALEIKEGNDAYMTFGTTNGAELIQISKLLKIDANIGVTNQATDFFLKDNQAAALDITESTNSYLKFDTTNSSELITAGVAVNFAAGLQIGTVAVTASAAELNILDGVTSTAAELNILDGVTSTAAELNILDGVTSTAAELNLLDGATATTAEINYLDTGVSVGAVAASKVLTVDANKDTSGARNITITGELDAATLDISGDADIDGTTNLDAVDIDGDVDLAGDLTFSAAKDIQIIDNNAAALEIAEAGNNYVVFHSTDGSEKVEVAKTLDVTGGLKIGGVAVTSDAADLNLIDGITAGTIAASKAVVVDSDKDISGFRNITLTGELDAATLDISGDADIDGTANLDAVDIDGATQIDGTVTVGVDDTGFDVKFFGATSGSYLLWGEDVDDLILGGAARVVVPDGQLVLGSTAVSSTAAEINTLDGVTAGTVSASKTVVVDANSDISGFRNITLTGELDAATLDISGDADIDGTLNADAVDIDGDVDLAGDLTFSAAKDIQLIDNNAAALEIAEAGNNYLTFDTSDSAERVHAKKDLVQNPASSIAPASNGELVVEATNNTTLTFKLKGSDGTVRTGTLTLS